MYLPTYLYTHTYIYIYIYIYTYIYTNIYIRAAFLTPTFDNMNKITYRQAEIDSYMPGEFKKCNQTPQKFAWNF